MKTYLALDPGKTTGWALFNDLGKPIQMGYAKYGRELHDLLMEVTPTLCYVVEEYRNRTEDLGREHNMRYAPRWDLVIAARAIGYIDMRAQMLNLEVKYQNSSIMPDAAKAFGLPYNRNHMLNAVLHGAFYAWKDLGILPPDRPIAITEEQVCSTRVVPIASYGGLGKAWKQSKKSKTKS